MNQHTVIQRSNGVRTDFWGVMAREYALPEPLRSAPPGLRLLNPCTALHSPVRNPERPNTPSDSESWINIALCGTIGSHFCLGVVEASMTMQRPGMPGAAAARVLLGVIGTLGLSTTLASSKLDVKLL